MFDVKDSDFFDMEDDSFDTVIENDISFFGDIFLRLHLRDLCYTGHNERLKNRDYNISLIYRLSVMLSLCYDPNMVIAAVPKS